jgi:nucleotide-binding universal stress UspA family protein
MRAIKKILVPTDFSPAAEEAFQMAQCLAKGTGASVTVFHVVLPPAFMSADGTVVSDASGENPKNLWDNLRKIQPEDSCVRVEHEIIVAKKSDASHILEAIDSLGGDLIVMGTTGRAGLKHLLFGSLAEDVVHKASCPVLVVKAPAGDKAD